ncbi:MAG: hypothetical protein AAF494_08510 [Pseudomonadota bacterium]
MDFWLAALLGAVSGGALIALGTKLRPQALAGQGYIALNVMLAIYVGVQLASGTLIDIVFEALLAVIVSGVTFVAMRRWLPAIGVAILLHGVYDALIGPHTGVAEWYPPLCAGFDLVVGLGLLWLLVHKVRLARTTALMHPPQS